MTAEPIERGDEYRAARRWLTRLAIGAFLLRLAAIAACSDAGLFADMRDYQVRALHLLRHGTFYPDAFWPPIYPVFLAAVYAIAGVNLFAVRLIQAGLGALSVALTFVLARRVLGPRASLVAAAVVAVYPALVLLPVLILSENVFVPLVLLGLWVGQRRERYAPFLAGIALAIATLTRSVGWAAIAGLAVSLISDRQERRQSASSLALLAAGCALVMLPWVARNAALYGRAVVVLDTASGYNLLLGNNPRATGRLELEEVPVVSETYWRHARTDLERNEIGYDAGATFILQNPVRFAGLAVRKSQFLLGLEGREWAWLYSEKYFGPRAAATVKFWGIALLVSFPVLVLAALIALAAPGLLRGRAGVAIVSTLVAALLLHVVSFGESRHHVPWVPLLAIVAARGLEPSALKQPAPLRIVLVTVAAALLVLTWLDQLPALLARLSALAAHAADPPRLTY